MLIFRNFLILLSLYGICHVGAKQIEKKTYLKCRKVPEKNAGKITVHTAQNGSKTPKTARPSMVNSRAGLLTAHQATTWAWAGNSAPRLGRRRPARPRPLCGRRIRSDGHAGVPVDQNPPPRARRPNPRAFPSYSPQPLLPPPPSSVRRRPKVWRRRGPPRRRVRSPGCERTAVEWARGG
jgi:hypothetical protein